jgi:predicted nucleic acid-binding Zn ribbon protein
MTERVCKGCGGSLPTMHGNRRYCSDNCRKRRWDGQNRWKPCVDCGTEIRDARRARCRPCFDAERARQHEARLALMAELYNAGVPLREIVAALGRKPQPSGPGASLPELVELRKAGRVGYRYKAYESRAA